MAKEKMTKQEKIVLEFMEAVREFTYSDTGDEAIELRFKIFSLIQEAMEDKIR